MSATPTDLAPRSVLMPVMDVGVRRVSVGQPYVSVPMGMRFAWRVAWRVLVLMVLVVVMEMFVFQRAHGRGGLRVAR